MKVDTPWSCASDAPTLVIIASIKGVVNDFAGTKNPIWAKYDAIPIILINVDFPPMFGPVIIAHF